MIKLRQWDDIHSDAMENGEDSLSAIDMLLYDNEPASKVQLKRFRDQVEAALREAEMIGAQKALDPKWAVEHREFNGICLLRGGV